MKMRLCLGLCVALLCLASPGLVRADIVLDSHAGLAACMYNSNGTSCGNTNGSDLFPETSGLTVVTQEHPAWQQLPVINPVYPSDSSAQWIGAVDSGYQGTQFVPYNPNAPVYLITSNPFTTGQNGGTLDLDVWADDTVNVLLVHGATAELISPPATALNNTCQPVPIGCTSLNEGVLIDSLLPSTTYTLEFQVWQTGTGIGTTSNPTALLYTGGVSVPEAGFYSTFALGLSGLLMFVRRKRQA